MSKVKTSDRNYPPKPSQKAQKGKLSPAAAARIRAKTDRILGE